MRSRASRRPFRAGVAQRHRPCPADGVKLVHHDIRPLTISPIASGCGAADTFRTDRHPARPRQGPRHGGIQNWIASSSTFDAQPEAAVLPSRTRSSEQGRNFISEAHIPIQRSRRAPLRPTAISWATSVSRPSPAAIRRARAPPECTAEISRSRRSPRPRNQVSSVEHGRTRAFSTRAATARRSRAVAVRLPRHRTQAGIAASRGAAAKGAVHRGRCRTRRQGPPLAARNPGVESR